MPLRIHVLFCLGMNKERLCISLLEAGLFGVWEEIPRNFFTYLFSCLLNLNMTYYLGTAMQAVFYAYDL